MGKVLAGITISVDGFITGPGDGPGCVRDLHRLPRQEVIDYRVKK
jgi:hypothetical protein